MVNSQPVSPQAIISFYFMCEPQHIWNSILNVLCFHDWFGRLGWLKLLPIQSAVEGRHESPRLGAIGSVETVRSCELSMVYGLLWLVVHCDVCFP